MQTSKNKKSQCVKRAPSPQWRWAPRLFQQAPTRNAERGGVGKHPDPATRNRRLQRLLQTHRHRGLKSKLMLTTHLVRNISWAKLWDRPSMEALGLGKWGMWKNQLGRKEERSIKEHTPG